MSISHRGVQIECGLHLFLGRAKSSHLLLSLFLSAFASLVLVYLVSR